MEGQPRPQQHHHHHHFLVVSFPAQGHVNPLLQLAKRLTRLGARVTFSTAVHVHAHRHFSPAPPSEAQPSSTPLLRYSPYSIGEYDDDFDWNTIDHHHFMQQMKTVGSRTLAELARGLATEGYPVTCVIYDMVTPWAADVAGDFCVPSALFWIQPATVFCVFYHYFHGYADLIASHCDEPFFQVDLPALPTLRVRDLPSFLTSKSRDDGAFSPVFEELFRSMDGQIGGCGAATDAKCPKLRVLVNTFEALERKELRASDPVELVPVGPALPSAYTDGVDGDDTAFGSDLFQPDARERYTGWLDSQPDRSVVYFSIGSFSVLSTRQRAEITLALEGCGCPYLWVARRNPPEGVTEEGGGRGMVVKWCSQVEVLSHRAVGCFVTHCGWNSTLESLACGVPIVGLPQWADQPTNMRLAGVSWGTGVRAEVGEGGILEAAELRRCLELVMGEGERGKEIRRNAAAWRERAREAVAQDGSSDRNLKAFVRALSGTT